MLQMYVCCCVMCVHFLLCAFSSVYTFLFFIHKSIIKFFSSLLNICLIFLSVSRTVIIRVYLFFVLLCKLVIFMWISLSSSQNICVFCFYFCIYFFYCVNQSGWRLERICVLSSFTIYYFVWRGLSKKKQDVDVAGFVCINPPWYIAFGNPLHHKNNIVL